jgi:hypothetical protein
MYRYIIKRVLLVIPAFLGGGSMLKTAAVTAK